MLQGKKTEEMQQTAQQSLPTVNDLSSKKARIEKPVTIEDVVIVVNDETAGELGKGIGEFSFADMKSHTPEQHQKALKNLLETIKILVNHFNYVHAKNLDKEEMREGCENDITRLTTNEFLFYTKNPLTIDEFKNLMEEVYKVAKGQPPNLHLVLASFAILLVNGKVKGNEEDKEEYKDGIISIVPYIVCGKDPQMSFIVKSYPSTMDLQYREPGDEFSDAGDYIELFGKDKYDIPQDQAILNVGGKDCPLSYNNVIRCKTAGGAEFHAGVNICLDHSKKVADENMRAIENKAQHSSELFPIQEWLLITSNTTSSFSGPCWEKTTYADRQSKKKKEPTYDKKNKEDDSISEQESIDQDEPSSDQQDQEKPNNDQQVELTSDQQNKDHQGFSNNQKSKEKKELTSNQKSEEKETSNLLICIGPAINILSDTSSDSSFLKTLSVDLPFPASDKQLFKYKTYHREKCGINTVLAEHNNQIYAKAETEKSATQKANKEEEVIKKPVESEIQNKKEVPQAAKTFLVGYTNYQSSSSSFPHNNTPPPASNPTVRKRGNTI